MTTLYKHKQAGTLIIWILGLPYACLLSIFFTGSSIIFSIITVFVSLILVPILALFSSLTVEVNNEAIIIFFGPRIFRKTLKIQEIIDIKIVRNTWRHGWGIRSLPEGDLYSVSGLDAVEIVHHKQRYRIGTDDPQGLCLAIQNARKRL